MKEERKSPFQGLKNKGFLETVKTLWGMNWGEKNYQANWHGRGIKGRRKRSLEIIEKNKQKLERTRKKKKCK